MILVVVLQHDGPRTGARTLTVEIYLLELASQIGKALEELLQARFVFPRRL